jgi:DNA polymerase-3 subunit alpha
VRSFPGESYLQFNIYEPKENLKVSLVSFEKGFQMNEEMADFLMDNPDVHVGLVG